MESMTRRAFVGAMSAVTLLALTSCASPSVVDEGNIAREETPSTSERKSSERRTENMAAKGEVKKILVVFFSCTGTTERIANIVASELGATEYRIEAQNPYTDADLAYYTDCRADREQSAPSARPAIARSLPDMGGYDAVMLGYPIWHGQAPRIIDTFLENCDFTGKTILPFCTSHSSGMGSSAESLHGLCPDTTWLPGRGFGADSAASEVADWLSSSGIMPNPVSAAAAAVPAAFSIGGRPTMGWRCR